MIMQTMYAATARARHVCHQTIYQALTRGKDTWQLADLGSCADLDAPVPGLVLGLSLIHI